MKRNLYFCLLLLVFPLCLQAQLLRRTGELTRFSLEIETGTISSFMDFRVDCFDCCDFGNCLSSNHYKEPMNAAFTGFKVKFHLNDFQEFGVGINSLKRGFTWVDVSQNNNYSSYKLLESYIGLALVHEINLLHGNKLALALGNEIQLDFYLGEVKYSSLYKHGLSHQASLILGFQASKHIELKLKGVGRTALSKYGDNAFDGPFHRFGTGLLLGMEYRLGKIKYHSPQKQ